MAWTYDLATDTGKVRLKIGDTSFDVAGVGATFSDEEIAVFLAANRTWKGAAADALDAIAAKIVQVMRDVTSQDLATQGSRTAAELRAQAKSLREQDETDSATMVQVW